MVVKASLNPKEGDFAKRFSGILLRGIISSVSVCRTRARGNRDPAGIGREERLHNWVPEEKEVGIRGVPGRTSLGENRGIDR